MNAINQKICWFVVQTKSGQEEAVALYLKQKGMETYLPKMEACVYHGLQKINRVRSLFPNYLFAACKQKNINWLCWTRGVKKVLWENNAPQPVADELVISLKFLADKDGLIRPALRNAHQKNDRVLITSGPFKDLDGIFDHWESDKKRVCLLLNIVNAQIRVTVPAASIAAA